MIFFKNGLKEIKKNIWQTFLDFSQNVNVMKD